MPTDDLSAPLGQGAKKKRRLQLPIAVPQAIVGALGLSIAAFAGWAMVADDPLGGEPMAVISTAAPQPAIPAVVAAGSQGPRSYEGPPPGTASATAASAAIAAPAPGTQTITIIDGSTGIRQQVAIPASPDAGAAVEQRMLDTSRHGPIPKIAADGTRPSDAYARPFKPAAGKPSGPQIAIVISGLGVSTSAAEVAFAKLPGTVTLAFSPYGGDAERLVKRARAAGHETLLQVPMEPFDYPDNDAGPQTLLTTLGADQNLDRLYWLMSRFQGYVGITNFMGARFTASEPAFSPVLREAAKRGLLYFDDGSSGRSIAGQIAGANNMPFAKAEVVLDSVPTPVNIDRALTRLEAIARERGVAVGIAGALPASIERIAQWAKAAEARGIVLVPISAVAARAKSS